jgi:hypothetical protein
MVDGPGATVVEGGSAVDFTLDGEFLARYHVGPQAPRPFLEPVIGPGGRRVTRAVTTPSRADTDPSPAGPEGTPIQEIPEESRDHPHHRGVWSGHRDVDGVDFWTEFDGHGRIVHRGFDDVVVEPSLAWVRHRLDWLDPSGRPRLVETRVVQVHGVLADGSRVFDIQTTLAAPDGTVTLGDTKEAGMVAVRVAPSMEQRRGGRIENAAGGVGEEECWGRPATWCDYSGEVDGQTVGIAVFDHPANPRHPTPWHVRAYGLLAANPFGYGDFYPGQGLDGTLRVTPEEPVCFRYRLLVHPGDAAQGRVAERYQEFVASAAGQGS